MEPAAGAVRSLERVTLSGFCQPVTVNEILKNADDLTIGLSIEFELSSDQERVLGNVVKDSVRERLNDEFQAKQRNVPLKERLKIEVTRKVRTANGPFVGAVRQPQQYCEMDKAEEERPSWQPRLDILTKASAEEKIYSVSVIPVDRSVKQTWYEKKGWIQKELFSAQDLQAAAELFDLEELDDGPSTAQIFASNELTSDKKEDPTKPATLYKGFIAPFAQFSSEVAKPQYQLDHLPPTITQAHAFSEESVENALADIQEIQLKDKIKAIVSSFQDDVHSEGMGMIVLQPGRIKVLYFSKL